MSSQPNEELKEISISALYNSTPPVAYEIPVYQRNYAWEKEEISTLIQDVYHAFSSHKEKNYYIGTLVSFCRGDQNGVRTYEVIDGQQRLTTILLILKWLSKDSTVECTNRLTYKARRKASNAIDSLLNGQTVNSNDLDKGILNGNVYVKDSLDEIVPPSDRDGFAGYFQNHVHIIHYQVPQDIDLNHYFEIMNSRGEQLEMSEIVKARLMEKLNNADKAKFSLLWECCSEMNVYVQQKYAKKSDTFDKIFAPAQAIFRLQSFDALPDVPESTNSGDASNSTSSNIESPTNDKPTINDILEMNPDDITDDGDNDNSFQPIMDFANFLLIVLKLTVRQGNIVLDDKELLNQFDKIPMDEDFVKKFGYNLLKARFFLDNYIVHHSCEEDTTESNPWKLQCWKKSESKCVDLINTEGLQMQLIHLLSMFEVSYTSRQRKNYLFYCLLYLFENDYKDLEKFRDFLSKLADKYFWDIYMKENENFDKVLLRNQISLNLVRKNKPDSLDKFKAKFAGIYGGKIEEEIIEPKWIPLFIFNYLDYKIWKKYSELGRNRKKFFEELGCTDFGLDCFDQFYFSRTRRSLEHYFPQANVDEQKGLTEEQINCFGNLAMIGGEANSSGSNWSPKAKLDHYLDSSGKIPQVSVASLKFLIMMQICKEEGWTAEKINDHQEKMLEILWQP